MLQPKVIDLGLIALGWSALIGFAIGGLYLVAFVNPERNRATRAVTAMLTHLRPQWWPVQPRGQMLVIAVVTLALAVCALGLFITFLLRS